ncbi:MAG: protease complex subunit PrcB family protein [Lachnospiraceae bacterium]|nr:protease complex subunit PrcB family protein [Lachnospiraceae bacterium]
MKNYKPKAYFLLQAAACILLMGLLLTGCGLGLHKTTKLRDLDFTVVSEELLPAELIQLIEERKAEAFEITYSDKEYLYLCVGYGRQETGGYSITVDELYLSDASIHINTSLLGPGPEEAKGTSPSYPYIVVKLEYMDETVEFD